MSTPTHKSRPLDLRQRGGWHFVGVYSDPPRGVRITWLALTENPTIDLARDLILGLRWPPIGWLTGYVTTDELAEAAREYELLTKERKRQ